MKCFPATLYFALIFLTSFSQMAPERNHQISIPPNRLAELDAYAKSTPKNVESDCQTLAAYLIEPATNESEKARLIFSWIAFHIKYDAKSFNSGNYGDMSARGVLKSRLGVCEGFANLFKALCEAGGLECAFISGYSKGYGYRPKQKFNKPGHAWNAVKADGHWYLMDATWGQGYGDSRNGRLVVRVRFDDYWFAPPSREFIFTHLPEDPAWQLLEDPISMEQFEQMPYIDPLLFYYGFNTEAIYTQVMDKNKASFVEVFGIDNPVEVITAPLNGKLRKGAPFTCTLRSENGIEVVALNSNKRTMFQQQGNLFTVTFTPESGDLYIGMKFSTKEKDYQIMLKYMVMR